MTAWLVLDVSASMGFGTALRRKADVAEGVALAVGHVATRRGNRLACSPSATRETRVAAPAPGPARTARAARRAAPGAEPRGATAPAATVARRWRRGRARAALARARGLVVVVSRLPRRRATGRAPLRTLRARHGVLAVEVRDPRELELPPVGDVCMADPETGRQIVVNTSRAQGARALQGRRRGRPREAVARRLRARGRRPPRAATDGDWLRDLAGHLRRRQSAPRWRRGRRWPGGRPRRRARAARAQPRPRRESAQ